MKIKVKKLHPDATLPKSAHNTDAGYDLVAVDDGIFFREDNQLSYLEYDTGIAVQPEKGFHLEIFPRSSVTKTDLMLGNGIGLVDNLYTGPVKLRFHVFPDRYGTYNGIKYKKGDRIGQLVVRRTEHAEFEWVEELSETPRNTGGFGSSGN